ncbi:hypothetical protein M2323_004446 [Rhodoblastus acidophilus]|uniref:hypothetical protein n=1 Tax=Rhodoblastus acidophilus TaxID=1074 RepID=UPI002225B6BE|nr:hypothetical protein [Rhodoblastus acidophilus]MCW2286677.1 hypothetical protein [Rhodoblastus acidophilus]MCW2335497.1 hypothetical protein [Rhodoblastus acidophilus]
MPQIARDKGVGVDKIKIWFSDEARIGQKNKITRRWAKPYQFPHVLLFSTFAMVSGAESYRGVQKYFTAQRLGLSPIVEAS